ncbi:Spy/CpxP family protein refolding chaperone [Herminiimonas sp. CN]|uniref:Spy/CpxP family protein refolding chaperone n=1 Tax=Herminiimonas sp. CN TaxID=1349818 RepID=UPI000473C27C|nr:Spy/CpxP family protein refolding chaperone [Herminiimonas sp. CN]
MRPFTKSIVIGMTVLGLGGTALAQMPPSDNAAKPGMMQGKNEKRGDRMQEYMVKRQAALHAKLKLSAAQEPAWKTYIDGMTLPAVSQRPDRAALNNMPAPERMQAMLDLMKQGQARMESHLAALKTFYAVLTPEQQKNLRCRVRPGPRASSRSYVEITATCDTGRRRKAPFFLRCRPCEYG